MAGAKSAVHLLLVVQKSMCNIPSILLKIVVMKFPKVTVKRSIAGLGLFAAEDIRPDTIVIEYTGERITTEEGDRRGGKYLFTLDEHWIIDGKDRSNISRYINHSCDPNCEAEIDEEEEKIYIRATTYIKKGEEITYDYGKEYWLEHCQPCRCTKCTKAKKKK